MSQVIPSTKYLDKTYAEYDERSRELMEKAAAVKIFWDAMSQSDGV